jgi:hypothetical protein
VTDDTVFNNICHIGKTTCEYRKINNIYKLLIKLFKNKRSFIYILSCVPSWKHPLIYKRQTANKINCNHIKCMLLKALTPRLFPPKANAPGRFTQGIRTCVLQTEELASRLLTESRQGPLKCAVWTVSVSSYALKLFIQKPCK